jgi:hypothetical protein
MKLDSDHLLHHAVVIQIEGISYRIGRHASGSLQCRPDVGCQSREDWGRELNIVWTNSQCVIVSLRYMSLARGEADLASGRGPPWIAIGFLCIDGQDCREARNRSAILAATARRDRLARLKGCGSRAPTSCSEIEVSTSISKGVSHEYAYDQPASPEHDR